MLLAESDRVNKPGKGHELAVAGDVCKTMLSEIPIINEMEFKPFLFWIRDVFCTQHLRVPRCKTHLKSRLSVPF